MLLVRYMIKLELIRIYQSRNIRNGEIIALTHSLFPPRMNATATFFSKNRRSSLGEGESLGNALNGTLLVYFWTRMSRLDTDKQADRIEYHKRIDALRLFQSGISAVNLN